MGILNLINNLRIIDVVIFVLVIFIFIFLIILASSLMKKNKALRNELSKINQEKINSEDLIIKQDNEQPNPPEVDEEEFLRESNSLLEEIEKNKEEDITEILEDLPEIEQTGPYTKNVLRELSRNQTSPVNIGNVTVEMPKIKVTSYVKTEEPKYEDIITEREEKEEQDNQTFIEEISKRMEEEVKPQTIELTDYEKKQEEEAIISYQELLKAKDRMYRITDDEEIDTFIDELKEFRTNLE